MAKIRVINKGQNQDLIGGNFNNIASETIFTLGRFTVSSNFSGVNVVDYTNKLSSFPKPITLENMGVNNVKSKLIKDFTSKVILNYDKSDLRSYVNFGSTREYLRVSVQSIIQNYVGSLFIDSQNGDKTVIFDYEYNNITNTTNFKVPSEYIVNNYGISFDFGNQFIIENQELKNLNVSYGEYVIWRLDDPTNNKHEILSFTGDTRNRPYVMLEVLGDPFPELTTSGLTNTKLFNYHLKPKPIHFNSFLKTLEPFQESMLTNRRADYSGYDVIIKQPDILDNGQIFYNNITLTWHTTDGYNVDVRYGRYESFLDRLLSVGSKYDLVKTDLIARFLVPESFINFDNTDTKKNVKLLRIYGKEFDNVKQYIDSLVNINKLSYNKKKNIPDVLIKNLASTFGWDDFSLIKSDDLVKTFFNVNKESNSTDLTPAELDIELWRRILLNTQYFWKTKGNKDAIKTILMMIGVPEPFINITEYVYTIDGKIDPNTVELQLADMPCLSLPYDSDGYPVAPIEDSTFYFQTSGNTDSGQAYLDVFRNVGFNLNRTVDNKKSWVYDDAVERKHYTTPNYYQENSKLILNTKEIDVAIDVARGVEYDVYSYIKNVDNVINSTGYTAPFTFVNLSLDYNVSSSIFRLQDIPEGDVVVTFNGITLVSGSTANDGDFYMNPSDPQEIILHNTVAEKRSYNNSDVIIVSYLYRKLGELVTNTIQYLVTRVQPSIDGMIIPLPDTPKGDVQLIVNGISLTEGSTSFNGDYTRDPNNPDKLYILNSELAGYLLRNPIIQVAMIVGDEEVTLEKRAEFHKVTSFTSGKVRLDNNINVVKYALNTKISNIDNIKITINGITIKPKTDYTLNPNNQYEILLPPIIKFGDVIGAYYMVETELMAKPIINDDFGLGDISNMSFLEFIDLLVKKKINARDRKIISDYSGGYYPSLLDTYIEYLKRSTLNDNEALKSNGYLFMDLYPYFDKYNSFFQNFVEQLLPATIIQRKSGFLIRNTVFTPQKFMYRRGVSFDTELNWLGDDGSEFIKRIPEFTYQWTPESTPITTSGLNDNFEINLLNNDYNNNTVEIFVNPDSVGTIYGDGKYQVKYNYIDENGSESTTNWIPIGSGITINDISSPIIEVTLTDWVDNVARFLTIKEYEIYVADIPTLPDEDPIIGDNDNVGEI